MSETIKFPTELVKIIDLCRKKGVESLEIEGLKITLRPDAPPSNYKKKQESGSDKIDAPEIYDEEAALFWSSAGLPDKEAL